MYIWNYLKQTDKPIVLYGTGNGGDKVFEYCDLYGVKIRAVFASDDRQKDGARFNNLPVESLASIITRFPDPIILFCFGSERHEVIAKLKELSQKYECYFPDMPVSEGPIITDEYVKEHADEIAMARDLLSDSQSVFVYDNILKFKHSGKIKYLTECESDPSEKETLLNMGHNEHYLDLGAYTGDTIEEFLEWTGGKFAQITALEPNRKNFEKLKQNISALPKFCDCDIVYDSANLCTFEALPKEIEFEQGNKINLINAAAWDKEEDISFAGKDGRNFAILTDIPGRKASPKQIKGISIDSLNINPTFIKMDIEGAERQALAGAEETIKRCHPKLAISVYHRTDDFFKLPLLLNKLCPGYKMYLRHHPALPAWELMLYCVYRDK